MEHIKVKEVSGNSQIGESEKERLRARTFFWIALILSAVFCLVAIVLFLWRRMYTLTIDWPINAELFGVFGDFVGGVLGTLLALYSIYLLYKTFLTQIKTNEDVITTNKNVVITNENIVETNKKIIQQTDLQIFDNRFSMLLNLYHQAFDAYIDKENKGRIIFEKLVREFLSREFLNDSTYHRRTISAISEYVEFYSNHSREFAVHFRMLYLLAKLTAEAKIYEGQRVIFAKSIRGHLSEGELVLLRYNCLSIYGEKMRQYVNQFNLLKHLPVMDLFEFSHWRKIITKKRLQNAINQFVLSERKSLISLIDSLGEVTNFTKVTSKYTIENKINTEKDKIEIYFIKNKLKKSNGSIKRPPLVEAFNCIPEEKVYAFLKDVFTEMFVFSNFMQYNGDKPGIIQSKTQLNDSEMLKVMVTIYWKNHSLALAQRQVIPSMKDEE